MYRGLLSSIRLWAISLMLPITTHAQPTDQFVERSLSYPTNLQAISPSIVRLEVSLSSKQVTIYQGEQKLKQYPIAIGRAGWETPRGTFRVNQVLRDPVWMNPLTGNIIPAGDPKNPLGRHWIGFLSESNIWYGFHGNNDPKSIGQAISHGCIRMHNADAEDLMRQITIGTEVRVFK
jgi:lipoprotein-anchoring transpeptidase ErfK/SrfK